MTVADVLKNWAMVVATVDPYTIQLLDDGWIDGSGWGSNYAYGPRNCWVGGYVIAEEVGPAITDYATEMQENHPSNLPIPSGWCWMYHDDVARNLAMAVAEVHDFNTNTLADGWIHGYGWNSNPTYGFGPPPTLVNGGWSGGYLIMKEP